MISRILLPTLRSSGATKLAGTEAPPSSWALPAPGRCTHSHPIFTVEVHVHQDQNYTTNLLQYIDWMSYDAFLVEEIVGRRYDGRNLLCVPRSRRAELALSSTLDLAAAARAIFAVNANSVHEHAYPCCKPGGKCCPTLGSRCCRSGDTLRWHRRQVAEWGRANSSFRGRNPLLFTHVNFFSQSRYKWSALKSG